MSKSTASLGSWDNRYGVRFDVENDMVTVYLTRCLLDRTTAYLQRKPQQIEAKHFITAFNTRRKLDNAIEAAKYWKSKWKIERDARAWPLAASLAGISGYIGGYMMKYLLDR